jgi:hypothetical protein
VVVGHIIPHEQKDGQQQKGDFLVAFELGLQQHHRPMDGGMLLFWATIWCKCCSFFFTLDFHEQGQLLFPSCPCFVRQNFLQKVVVLLHVSLKKDTDTHTHTHRCEVRTYFGGSKFSAADYCS